MSPKGTTYSHDPLLSWIIKSQVHETRSQEMVRSGGSTGTAARSQTVSYASDGDSVLSRLLANLEGY
jgi:hypothetical protein